MMGCGKCRNIRIYMYISLMGVSMDCAGALTSTTSSRAKMIPAPRRHEWREAMRNGMAIREAGSASIDYALGLIAGDRDAAN